MRLSADYSANFCQIFTTGTDRAFIATQYVPDTVENVERIVELGLLRVVLDGEETGVTEVDPRDNSESEDTVARWALVQVQYQTRVEELLTTQFKVASNRFFVTSLTAAAGQAHAATFLWLHFLTRRSFSRMHTSAKAKQSL